MYFNIEVYKGNDDIFVAVCPELNLYAHAKTQQEAVEAVRTDIEKFIDGSTEFAEAKDELDFSVRHYSSGSTKIH